MRLAEQHDLKANEIPRTFAGGNDQSSRLTQIQQAAPARQLRISIQPLFHDGSRAPAAALCVDDLDDNSLNDRRIRTLVDRVDYAIDEKTTFPISYSDGAIVSARDQANRAADIFRRQEFPRRTLGSVRRAGCFDPPYDAFAARLGGWHPLPADGGQFRNSGIDLGTVILEAYRRRTGRWRGHRPLISIEVPQCCRRAKAETPPASA